MSPSSTSFNGLLPVILLSIIDSTWQWEYPVGPCVLVGGPSCSYPTQVKVYLYTRSNPSEPQYVYCNATFDNISMSYFNAYRKNKMIIHGYDSDMFLGPLLDIKTVLTAYLSEHDYNVWAVDWSPLCEGPCYPFAVFNLIQTGRCIADFIRRLQKHVDSPLQLHVIAFSLGAHAANYVANFLTDYKLPRITDPLDCDHHRAPQYFAESITTKVGFLGAKCGGFMDYLMGLCLPIDNPVLMGEYCDESNRGFHIVYTAAQKPFALGKWTANYHKQKIQELFNTTTTNMNMTVLDIMTYITNDSFILS